MVWKFHIYFELLSSKFKSHGFQSLAARPHQVGHNIYEPIEEEDTDDEEASKIIEATKARSHLDEEKELNQPTKVNVNVKDEDTDDEFSKC